MKNDHRDEDNDEIEEEKRRNNDDMSLPKIKMENVLRTLFTPNPNNKDVHNFTLCNKDVKKENEYINMEQNCENHHKDTYTQFIRETAKESTMHDHFDAEIGSFQKNMYRWMDLHTRKYYMQISIYIIVPTAIISIILLTSITIILFSISSQEQPIISSIISHPLTNQSNPQSKPQFIVVRGGGHGLCNTLGHIACSLYLADAHDIPSVAYYWRTEDHFLEIFTPISNLLLLHNNDDYLAIRDSSLGIEYDELHRCEYSFDNVAGILDISGDTLQELRTHMYKKFKPTFYVDSLSKQFVVSHRICNCLAIHVRRTDYGEMGEPDQFFLDKINSEVYSSMNIFLLTDNDNTRQFYIDNLGSHRVIVFGSFDYEPSRQRLSSIVHAGTEMMIATYAKYFIGTSGSSFSKTIQLFRDVYEERRLEMCS